MVAFTRLFIDPSMHVLIYTYIHVYIYIERERERYVRNA